MSGVGAFPSSVTTSTTTTTTTTKVTPLIWFDSSYVHTRPGQLKVAAVVLDLVAFISAAIGPCATCGSVVVFNIVSILAFWVSFLLLALYLFHVIEKQHTINWLLAEFVYTGFWSTFFFVVSLTILTNGGVYAAAGFFGLACCSVYAYDSFLKYQAYQAGEVAQGDRSFQPQGMP